MKNPEFIAHGSMAAESVKGIKDDGFKYEEGREMVTTDFLFAMDFAHGTEDAKAGSHNTNSISETEPGSLIVMKVPEGYKIDYGTETSIDTDDKNKIVSGHAGKYFGGRAQLAIYRKELTDIGLDVAALKNEPNPMIKAASDLGREMDPIKKVEILTKLEQVLGAENIAAEIKATPKVVELTERFKKDLPALKISIPEAVKLMADEIEDENKIDGEPVHLYKDRPELEKILKGLLEGSLSNSIQTKIRNLSLKIRILEGYEINDQDNIPGIEFKKRPREEIEEELRKTQSYLDRDGFTTGLPVMDRYLATYIPQLQKRLDNIPK